MQDANWRVFVADAFSKSLYGGNQAGVVVLGEKQEYPAPARMCAIAAELKHSETAFVKKISDQGIEIRYYTPVEEVELCGHATIGAFQVLFSEGMIGTGQYELYTKAQKLAVSVEPEGIWMDMAAPKELSVIQGQDAQALYQAYGLAEEDRPRGLFPKIINTGLSDILLPVKTREALNRAVQNYEAVNALSKNHEVVGVHMFCISDQEGITAECRNFAPLYGIPEEAATGTANGALTYYLYLQGLIKENQENIFLQGEAMGRPSYVKSRLTKDPEAVSIQIGGRAVISLKGELMRHE